VIGRDVLATWDRLAEHPELFAAVNAGTEDIDRATAFRCVLERLAMPRTPAVLARALIQSGEWEPAAALLEIADLAPDERLELQEELRVRREQRRSELEVELAVLHARALAADADDIGARIKAAIEADGADGSVLRELDGEIQLVEDAALAELDKMLTQRTSAEGLGSTRVLRVQQCLRDRRPRAARRVLLDRGDDPAAWPRSRGGQATLGPEFVVRRPRWPWSRPLDESLGWFGQGPRAGSTPAPGFGSKWLPARGDAQAGPYLNLLARAAVEPTASRRTTLFAEALVIGLDAKDERAEGAVIRLHDPRLAFASFLARPFVVEPVDDPGRARGLSITVSTDDDLQFTALLTWGDVLGTIGAGHDRRVGLLRNIGAQLPPSLMVDGAASPETWSGPDGTTILIAWAFDLAAVVTEPGVVDGLVELTMGKADLALALAAHLLRDARRGTPIGVPSLQAAWLSNEFREAGRRIACEALEASPLATALLELSATLDADDLSLSDALALLDRPAAPPDAEVAGARDALARLGLAQIEDGQMRTSVASRQLIRRLLLA
jgi:hypothetical protein